jgi:Holliday junction resolvase-like predicted endonuclease
MDGGGSCVRHAELAVLLCGMLASAWLALRLRSLIHTLVLRRRFRRAASGEDEARRVLEARGFRVVADQQVVAGEMEVDRERHRFEVRIDYLVERRGRMYGVEVKTGAKAVDPLAPATRRQLREYSAVLPIEGLFLLDMESRRLMTIRFPARSGPGHSAWWILAVGFALGAAATLLLLQH